MIEWCILLALAFMPYILMIVAVLVWTVTFFLQRKRK